MRRAGNLWPRVTSFANLLAAATAAARGKRKRPDVAAFLLNLEPELIRLRRELADGAYQPGPYRTFTIHEPKPRLISAAPFRDRVVHHAFTRVVEPIFEKRFTADTFACRARFGTHRAIRRAKAAAEQCACVLKCDIRKYFASIDHAILKDLLAHVIKCRPTLDLAGRIIDGSNPQEQVIAYYPGDDLFTPHERHRGLPLGNQTSQFFANVYLNPLDHFVRRVLRPRSYVRYVDDFLLFADDKSLLADARHRIEDFLCALRLRIHPGRSRVYRTSEGIPFLGWRIFPGRLRLAKGNVARFRRRIHALHAAHAAGLVSRQEVETCIRAWIAHAAHGDTWRLREQIFSRYNFTQRCAV